MATTTPVHQPTIANRRIALEPDQIREECSHFRILVIGKANAGKTTILRKVCNVGSDVKPIVMDENGGLVEIPSDEDNTKDILKASELVSVQDFCRIPGCDRLIRIARKP